MTKIVDFLEALEDLAALDALAALAALAALDALILHIQKKAGSISVDMLPAVAF